MYKNQSRTKSRLNSPGAKNQYISQYSDCCPYLVENMPFPCPTALQWNSILLAANCVLSVLFSGSYFKMLVIYFFLCVCVCFVFILNDFESLCALVSLKHRFATIGNKSGVAEPHQTHPHRPGGSDRPLYCTHVLPEDGVCFLVVPGTHPPSCTPPFHELKSTCSLSHLTDVSLLSTPPFGHSESHSESSPAFPLYSSQRPRFLPSTVRASPAKLRASTNEMTGHDWA